MLPVEHFSTILRGESNIEFLSEVVESNPWFALSAALLIRDLTKAGDLKAASMVKRDFALSFMANNYRGVMTVNATTNDSQCKTENTLDLIDSFLSKSIGRIIPNENAINQNYNIDNEPIEEDIITEQFAKILLMQGHKERAIAIYKKLSLKFPEKSVYFANQLDQIK
ncbi:MAG: hypothetical protein RR277_06205 [Rikenellaceae bacterium]